jgi:putative ABC transport system permease protein
VKIWSHFFIYFFDLCTEWLSSQMNRFFHFENLRIAFKNIRANWLRTILTITVIIFGIMALVGMLTAIDGLKNSLLKNLSMIGSNTFSIDDRNIFASHDGKQKVNEKITYRQALLFKEKFSYSQTISLVTTPLYTATVKYLSKKTNPKIRVTGTDENYLLTSALEIDKGRNFNSIEIQYGANVAIIGSTLANYLFKKQDPTGKVISVGSKKFRVIGVLKETGNSFGFSSDNALFIPILSSRRAFPEGNNTYSISIYIPKIENLEAGVQEAIGIFRVVRNLRPGEDNNFNIRKSDSLVNIINDQLSVITYITLVISLVTLLGSAVALMNIMLVSVKERIQEIGTLKAIGATVQNIKAQFLSEALLISQIGGLIGIVAGIGIGNFVAKFMGSSFFIPWFWVIMALVTSLVVGVSAGYYPAVKAAKLDPIEALRYE